MNEAALRSVLSRIGIVTTHRSSTGWLDFPCPIAQWTHAKGFDRSPSAGAKIEDSKRSSWICHTCKSHGSISRLVYDIQSYSGRSFPGLMREVDEIEATAVFTEDYGDFETGFIDDRPEPLDENAYGDIYPRAYDFADAAAYLKARGISETTADSLGLKWHEHQRRVMFPVRDREGKLYGFTGRAVDPNVEPRIKDFAGLPKRHLVLGSERWTNGKPLVVVEGLFGYAHLVDIGIETVANVGAILGSYVTPEKAEAIRGLDEPVYLLLDNDTAGEVGIFGTQHPDGRVEGSALLALREYVPVYVPAWPEGKADPDQLSLADVKTMLETTDVS